MKKLFQIGAILCCVCCANSYAAQDTYEQIQGGQPGQIIQNDDPMMDGANYGANYQGGWGSRGDMNNGYAAGGSCGQDCGCVEQAQCPPDQRCGDCYCMYCHYEPCYYNCWRCCEEPQYYKKKCCRYVPRYYQVQRCRYVPQYYCETYCREEPEYYCVDECKMCKRWVCDRKCKYVPKYYYKHECNPCATPCAPGCCQ